MTYHFHQANTARTKIREKSFSFNLSVCLDKYRQASVIKGVFWAVP